MFSVRFQKTGEDIMSFIVNKKYSPEGFILIVTDKEIVGKVFEEGKKQLDLSKKFYSGDERNAEAVKALIPEVYILHLTGERAVALGVELKLVDSQRIVWVDNVPHAEVLISNS
jgi:hypothetical protein